LCVWMVVRLRPTLAVRPARAPLIVDLRNRSRVVDRSRFPSH